MKVLSIFLLSIFLLSFVGCAEKVVSIEQAERAAVGIWETQDQFFDAEELQEWSRIVFNADHSCKFLYSTNNGKTWAERDFSGFSATEIQTIQPESWEIKKDTYTDTGDDFYFISFPQGGKIVLLDATEACYVSGGQWAKEHYKKIK